MGSELWIVSFDQLIQQGALRSSAFVLCRLLYCQHHCHLWSHYEAQRIWQKQINLSTGHKAVLACKKANSLCLLTPIPARSEICFDWTQLALSRRAAESEFPPVTTAKAVVSLELLKERAFYISTMCKLFIFTTNILSRSIEGWNLLKSLVSLIITICFKVIFKVSFITDVLNLLLGLWGSILRWNDLGYIHK